MNLAKQLKDLETELCQLKKTSLTLMTFKKGIDGATATSTNLAYETGITAATYTPTIAIVKYASGAIGICEAKVKSAIGDLTASTLLAVTASVNHLIPLSGLVSAGVLSVEVTVESLAASTFDIYIYGVKTP